MKMHSTKKSLPPIGVPCLVKRALGDGFCVAAYNPHASEITPNCMCWWDEDGRSVGHVTHWMNPRLLEIESA